MIKNLAGCTKMRDNKKLNFYIEDNLTEIYYQRFISLCKLDFHKLLKQNNPFIFKIRYFHMASDIINALLETYLYSIEESLLGEFLERLASHINENYSNWEKSMMIDCFIDPIDMFGYSDFIKFKSQKFWESISGQKDFYLKIIQPLSYRLKERNSELMDQYSALVNKFSGYLISDFCQESGALDWDKLGKFNSAI
ncbi:MAG: PmeII family type II restriction endonuclease [Candidatus Stygibacter frigidus]|nr:PmeII family type II restriction endonuclease [Candidatus Stygibacter frigidus]